MEFEKLDSQENCISFQGRSDRSYKQWKDWFWTGL